MQFILITITVGNPAARYTVELFQKYTDFRVY